MGAGSPGSSCARQGGEYLALTGKDGTPLPPVWSPYPAQSTDVSFGLLSPSATAQGAYFAVPTPGAPNNVSSALAEEVTFTPTSQTFGVGTPLSVSLSVQSASATIRYTTNRSRPIDKPGFSATITTQASTDLCTLANHGLTSGDLVRVSTSAPLNSAVNYFAQVVDSNTFKLAIAPDGPAIDLLTDASLTLNRDAAIGSAATTDIITSTLPHTFYSGDVVQVSSTGTLPGGLAAGTPYYVTVASATTFRLSPSPTLTPVVDITTTGTGTLTIFRTPSPIYAGPISVAINTRIRARAFEANRPAGPLRGEMYFAIDTAAQQITSNLPLLLSHTWNTVMANNVAVDGHIMVFEPKAPDNLARLTNPPDLVSPGTLERHGSSTGGDPKFSMALELQDENGIDQECSPFGMPENADWLMHAPYQFDRSMMHNDLVYRTSNDLGRYAPRTRLIEHIHNEQSLPDTFEGAIASTDYFGVYSFMEKITRGSKRVDVENLTLADNTLPNIQGGYMFKVDRLDAGESGIRPLTGQTFGGVGSGGPGADILAWVNPREVTLDPFKRVTTAQSDWFRGHLGEAWSVLSGASYQDPVNGYAKYWDVAAAIDHHILNVATKNPDGLRLSAYWHKPRMGKLTAGPVWDFDRCEGSTDGRDFDWGTWLGGGGTDFFNYPWYREMFRDTNFWQAWIDRYHLLRQGPLATATLHARIDEFAQQLNPGDAPGTPAKRSAMRWAASAPRAAGSNTAITNMLFNGQYVGEVAWLKYWWERRLNFMDSQITRPAVASQPEGFVTAGSSIVLTSPSQSLPGVKIYYTTDGTDPRAKAPGPMLSASAIEYTAPIVITKPTKLFIRVLNPTPVAPVGSGFSAPTNLSYSPM